jgi:hypothetical protein
VSGLVLELAPPESRHYGSWKERLQMVARYSRVDEMHVVCEKAHALGAEAVVAVLDERVRQALREFQRWRDVPVWAVVPNMFAFIRDLTDLGVIGAARKRFARLGPLGLMRSGVAVLRRLGELRRSEFTSGVLLLIEMELAAVRELRIRRLFLHPQVTEVALAGQVSPLLVAFASRAEELGLEPGLITHNPLVAATLLGPELRRFAAVIAPGNPKGYKMFPDRAATERLFASDPARFWAAEATAGGMVCPSEAVAHVRHLGLAGAVLDVEAVNALYREQSSAREARV